MPANCLPIVAAVAASLAGVIGGGLIVFLVLRAALMEALKQIEELTWGGKGQSAVNLIAQSAMKDLSLAAAEWKAHVQAEAKAEVEGTIAALEAENRRARVQVPLWRGVAAAMVERASKVKCQFGGDHSVADCRCDPHQMGDAIKTMHDLIAEAAREADHDNE